LIKNDQLKYKFLLEKIGETKLSKVLIILDSYTNPLFNKEIKNKITSVTGSDFKTIWPVLKAIIVGGGQKVVH